MRIMIWMMVRMRKTRITDTYSCITKLGRLAGQWTCRCDGGNDDEDGDAVVDDEDGDDDDENDDDNHASVVKWMRQG